MRLNLAGQRFGKLVAIKLSDKLERSSRSWWICKCDCGKEALKRTNVLRRGWARSCGCSKYDVHFLPGNEASFNQYYGSYKNGARQRHIEFSISKEEFRFLTGMPCSYCGAPPIERPMKIRKTRSVTLYIGNGIDRIDNLKGYIDGNCTPCCGTCNYMKRGLSAIQFRKHIKTIFYHGLKDGE